MKNFSKPKIIFFDIDDTLFIKSQNIVPTSVYNALQALQNNGIQLAIATGRGQGIFPRPIIDLINRLNINILVTINGQYTILNNQKIADFPLNKTQIYQVNSQLQQKNLGYAYMTCDKLIVFNETTALKNALNSLHIQYSVMNITDFKDEPIYQILAFYDDNKQLDLILDDTLKTVRWHISGVDILDKSGSKARGILAVLDRLNLTSDDIAVVGDGLNDIEMFCLAKTAIAVGNAHQSVKDRADIITDDIVNDGIYKAFVKLGWI